MLTVLKRLRFLIALLAAIVAGVMGASAVMGATEPPAPVGPADLVPDGSGATIAATAADPDAGAARGATAAAPRWAVRVYRSESGLTCPDVNRVVGGDWGRVDGDGSFHPLALDASGECVALTAEHPYELVVRHLPANDERGARAIVFGVATASVTAITLTIDGAARDVPVDDGAFVAALAEEDASATTVQFALTGGAQETHALRSDPAIGQP
jgi:hypothetical protein